MPVFSDGIDIGQDFSDNCPGLTQTTVQQINPDSGAVGLSSSNVDTLKRVTQYGTVGVGEGEIGATECKFWLRASQISFTVVNRCRIVDAEGITWEVGERVRLVGFEALWECEGCVRMR
jgi:hypothetical protein